MTINVARTALKGVTFHNSLKTNRGFTLFLSIWVFSLLLMLVLTFG